MPLPLHKSSDMTGCGIRLRTISADHPHDPVTYAHRDDYYIFGFIEEGHCAGSIDFVEREFPVRSIICIRPWQVHSVVRTDSLKAFMLLADESLLSDLDRLIFDEYTLSPAPCTASEEESARLSQLYALLSEQIGMPRDETGQEVIYGLAHAVIGLTAGALRRHSQPLAAGGRQVKLAMEFRRILQRDLHLHKSPSHYASELNISPVYLNEVVRTVTGMSVSRYIRSEAVLRAKRQLAYTGRSVQEIAFDLGFDDPAYFSRLFSAAAGMSPSEFRRKISQQK